MTTTVATAPAPLSKAAVLAALEAAWSAPVPPWPGPACGCGRAYVCISADRATVNAVAAACRTLTKRGTRVLFLRTNYGAGGNAIYCGYDNGGTAALAKARAVCASLKAAGIACYEDAASD